MKTSFTILIALTASIFTLSAAEKYLDPSLPVDVRVDDLISKMTLEEKVGQMCEYVGIGHAEAVKKAPDATKTMSGIDAVAADNLGIKGVAKRIALGEVGSCLHVTGVEEANRIQEYAKLSRLKIPVRIGIDAIHGNGLHSGMTIYPTSIGQASTFNPELAKEIARQTAVEMRASGMHLTFAPNIEIVRDPRWGRTAETFGEDTLLVSRMGVAFIKGLQGDNGVQPDRALACAKHMLAGGEPAGGINAAPMDMSEQKMREVFLPPFIAAVKEANTYSVMPAHNEINGIPCHANKHLLLDILRGELGFTGSVISDWMDIQRLHSMHGYVPSANEAYIAAVNAGVDVHMQGPHFFEAIVAAVKNGRVSEQRIDQAVRKILEAKFTLGLFETPLVDIPATRKLIFSQEHKQTALDAARQSIVLLRNDKALLPLDPAQYKGKTILVTGPNADSAAMMGDWVFQQPRENYVTVLDAVKKLFPDAQIETACIAPGILQMKTADIQDAAQKAKTADLNIVVVGDNSLRYPSGGRTCGENSDRDNLDLPGRQQELLEQIHASGKPTILVLINGRPASIEWASENIPAIIEAWEPGSFGGQAIAEIITGAFNPSGKLPITFPRNVGQIPTIYNHKKSQYSRQFATSKTGALYHFGYGLSYTDWTYGNPVLSKTTIAPDESLTISCDLTNSGTRQGTETVQLYICDQYGSVTRPVKELKDFRKITLNPGETKTITFQITPATLQFFTANKKWEVEPGEFTIMIGSSSRDEDLKKTKLIVK